MIASIITLIDAGVTSTEIATHTGFPAHEVELLRMRLTPPMPAIPPPAPAPAGLTLRQRMLASAAPDFLCLLNPDDRLRAARRALADIDTIIAIERETAP